MSDDADPLYAVILNAVRQFNTLNFRDDQREEREAGKIWRCVQSYLGERSLEGKLGTKSPHNMFWCITKDVLGDGIPSFLFDPSATLGIPFRLLSDDNELYYEGRIDLDAHPDVTGFEPLDWAQGYAGCTSILLLEPEQQVEGEPDVWTQP